jgi:hypothetical protein
MKVKRASTSIFWVEINLVGLSKRIGLDEVPLVVHMEPVVRGVLFEIGNISSDINGGHNFTLPARAGFAVGMSICPLSCTSVFSLQALMTRTFSLRVNLIGRLQ